MIGKKVNLLGGVILLCIFIYFVSRGNLIENLENTPGSESAAAVPNERVSSCVESIKKFQDHLEFQKQEEQKEYEKQKGIWQKAKNEFEKKFAEDPSMWGVCKDNKNLCTMTQWFDKYPNGLIATPPYMSLPGVDEMGCLSLCALDDACDYAMTSRAGCTLQAANIPSYTATTSFDTKTGWRDKPNVVPDDKFANLLKNETANDIDECKKKCKDDSGCKWFVYDPTTKLCMMRHMGGGGGGNLWVKRKTPEVQFPDSHEYIKTQFGEIPRRKDFIRPFDPKLVCQDCSQYMDNISATESKDVALQQAQKCIASLADSKTTTTGGAGSGTSSGTSSGTGGGSTPAPSDPAASDKASASDESKKDETKKDETKKDETNSTGGAGGTSTNNTALIVGGVSIALLVLSVLGVIAFMFFRRSKE